MHTIQSLICTIILYRLLYKLNFTSILFINKYYNNKCMLLCVNELPSISYQHTTFTFVHQSKKNIYIIFAMMMMIIIG